MLNVLLIGNNLEELQEISLYLNEQFGPMLSHITENKNDVFESAHERLPDIILLDYGYDGSSGPDFCNTLKNK